MIINTEEYGDEEYGGEEYGDEDPYGEEVVDEGGYFYQMGRVPLEHDYMSHPSEIIDEEDIEESECDSGTKRGRFKNSPLKLASKAEELMMVDQKEQKFDLDLECDMFYNRTLSNAEPSEQTQIDIYKENSRQALTRKGTQKENESSKEGDKGKAMLALPPPDHLTQPKQSKCSKHNHNHEESELMGMKQQQ